jgi:metallo-beta-lactamase class B
MYLLVITLLAISTGSECLSRRDGPKTVPADTTTLLSSAGSVTLSRIADAVWVHTTYKTLDSVKTPANGLLIVTEDGLVLVDTPWTVEQTDALMALAKDSFGVPVKQAIITHAHEDRVGGVAALTRPRVAVLATEATVQLAGKQGYSLSDSALQGTDKLCFGDTVVETFFPGRGHTADNIVVWLPEQKILFAGCLVKAAATKNIISAGDACMSEWPQSLTVLKERYQDAAVVVPGHGEWGGTDLIDHTLELLVSQ